MKSEPAFIRFLERFAVSDAFRSAAAALLACAAIPMLFFIPFFQRVQARELYNRSCTAEVPAVCETVIVNDRISGGRFAGHTTYYTWQFTYTYKGETYHERYPGEARQNYFPEGTEITVLVAPSKPAHFCAAKDPILRNERSRMLRCSLVSVPLLVLLGGLFVLRRRCMNIRPSDDESITTL